MKLAIFGRESYVPTADDPNAPGNEWIVADMSIKGDYCDMWYEACQYDNFCGAGDFFNCSREYQAADNKQNSTVSGDLTPGGIAGIVVGSVVFACGDCYFSWYHGVYGATRKANFCSY